MDPTLADVWLVDGQRVAKLRRHFLDRLLLPAPTDGVDPYKVLIVDFSDRFQFQLRHYDRLGIWNTKNIRIAVRSIVTGRFFNSSASKISVGRIVTPNMATRGGPMLHCPYAVRTDIVRAVRAASTAGAVRLRSNRTKDRDRDNLGIPDDLELMWLSMSGQSRPIDVNHMWSVTNKEGKSQLRNLVSRAVESWNGTVLSRSSNDGSNGDAAVIVQSSIREYGRRRKVGRNVANIDYVRAMLRSKIVVVAQKDEWEDHYRLLEAMVCGPLVITDTMLSLELMGLKNATHLLMYSNTKELWNYVAYYLIHEEERAQIARRGFYHAMKNHRSWHRMEQLIFGRAITGHQNDKA